VLTEKVRQEAKVRAPGRRLSKDWVKRIAEDAQDYNYCKEDIDSRIERDLRAGGITPWEQETQEEWDKEIRDLPSDQARAFTKFLQRPEPEQEQILSQLDEHDQALLKEFKVRQQLVKNLSSSSAGRTNP
jgi:hypothetical protein